MEQAVFRIPIYIANLSETLKPGIINVALPHIRNMWRRPAELSKKIEETANMNLKDIVRVLPVSYPLQREILGHVFHVGNLFQVRQHHFFS